MATKICSRCKAEILKKARFCNQCGNNEFIIEEKCSSCGNNLPYRSVKFCPSCGKRISDEKTKVRSISAPEGVIHKCGICKLEIKNDLTICPSCLNTYHFNHLANWIVEKHQCPICKKELVFVD